MYYAAKVTDGREEVFGKIKRLPFIRLLTSSAVLLNAAEVPAVAALT